MKEYIKNHIKSSCDIKENILKDDKILSEIKSVAEKTIEIYKTGNKVIIAGNGGSAADAQHIAGEFVSRFYFDRPGLSAIAITTDTSIITAIGNDYGYEKIFSRQIQANGVQGDIFIGISTSGNSKNIIEALIACKDNGIISIGMTGAGGGKMKEYCDFCIEVPSNETPRIQESHILIGHIICAIVEESIFGKGF